MRYVRPGGAVGVAALVGAQHPLSIRAITASQILQLDLDRVRAIVERDPDTGRAVARELAARMFDTYAEFAVQARGSVRQRLAGYLLQVMDAEATATDDALIVRRTHEELAEAIGSAREVVSKTLAALAHEGTVELGRSSIRVLFPIQLHVAAHSPMSHGDSKSASSMRTG